MQEPLGSFLLPCFRAILTNMEKHALMGQRIVSVDQDSPAERFGLHVGDQLLSIDGEPVIDIIDYEFLTANGSLRLKVADPSGQERTVSIRKEEYEPLGLSFGTSLMDRVRVCRNRCVFCFVDQMPKGVRTSLSFKDDDWRLSFIMGNYVTLTNLSDGEFERILKRHVSPLYVSVHATDPELRSRLMGNPTAGRLMERLAALKEQGLQFHSQVVLCPGENDGASLDKTIADLARLSPSAQSLAVVPVGLTRFRDGLYPLKGFEKEGASRVIDQVEAWQKKLFKELDTRFVFLSDEWYLLAGRPLPEADTYEGYPQIENGVGLIRLFEEDFRYALEECAPLKAPKRVSFAGGFGATPVMAKLLKELEPYNISFETFGISNDFFGGNVSVAGLVTGQDLINQLQGRLNTKELMIPRCMLREQEDVFLDDMTLSQVEEELQITVTPISGGDDLISKLWME